MLRCYEGKYELGRTFNATGYLFSGANFPWCDSDGTFTTTEVEQMDDLVTARPDDMWTSACLRDFIESF